MEVGLFIPLPEVLAEECPSLAPEDNSVPHVTFLYVGEVPGEREDEFLQVVQEAFSSLGNVHASLGKLSYFVHPEQTIAHMRVRFDQDLRGARQRLRESLEAAGFSVEDSYPLVYHPHVTLAYLEGTDRVYEGPRPYGGWTFNSIEVWGLPQVHTVRFGVNPQRVAFAWSLVAKYQKKVKDEEGNTHYEYGPRQVAERHKEKAKKVEKLRKSIGGLRERVLSDLQGKDEKKRLLALVVALIDATYERVGNEDSAKDGHFGVTGWQAQHLEIKGDKATITYVGKSGVNQKKVVDDPRILSVLREVSKDKSGKDSLMAYGEEQLISSKDVNEYLSKFGVTAKDLRGFHANREMSERLKKLRKKGPTLPKGRKEKDDVLRKEFEKALAETADAVGHEEATLRSEYLVPGLEDDFLHDGTVLDTYLKKGTKTRTQAEDEEVERLVRPSPKKKPPRKDKRRNQVQIKDSDLGQGDRGDDKDLSLNYKRVGGEKIRQSTSYNETLIGERVGHGEGIPPLFSQTAAMHWREDMPRRMTKKGAQQVVVELDRLASVMQDHWEALGVPKRAALDLAYRCDLLSDYIEKSAGLQPSVKNEGFDPSEIAAEESGALESNKDEAYTKKNFTEQEHRELREKQEAGKLPSAEKLASQHGFNLFASDFYKLSPILLGEVKADVAQRFEEDPSRRRIYNVDAILREVARDYWQQTSKDDRFDLMSALDPGVGVKSVALSQNVRQIPVEIAKRLLTKERKWAESLLR